MESSNLLILIQFLSETETPKHHPSHAVKPTHTITENHHILFVKHSTLVALRFSTLALKMCVTHKWCILFWSQSERWSHRCLVLEYWSGFESRVLINKTLWLGFSPCPTSIHVRMLCYDYAKLFNAQQCLVYVCLMWALVWCKWKCWTVYVSWFVCCLPWSSRSPLRIWYRGTRPAKRQHSRLPLQDLSSSFPSSS